MVQSISLFWNTAAENLRSSFEVARSRLTSLGRLAFSDCLESNSPINIELIPVSPGKIFKSTVEYKGEDFKCQFDYIVEGCVVVLSSRLAATPTEAKAPQKSPPCPAAALFAR